MVVGAAFTPTPAVLLLQELVEIVGRSTGIALMAPPTDSNTAQKTLDTLLSAVNKKQKVCIFYNICIFLGMLDAAVQSPPACCLHVAQSQQDTLQLRLSAVN